MLDEKDFLNCIKKAASNAFNASKPANIYFGSVIAAGPLQIQIDQKLILTQTQLIIPQHLTDHEIEIYIDWETEEEEYTHSHDLKHTHTLAHVHEYTDESTSGTTTKETEKNKITETSTNTESTTTSDTYGHNHKIEGKKTMTVYAGLKTSEKVVLIRNQGGQKYLVVGRI